MDDLIVYLNSNLDFNGYSLIKSNLNTVILLKNFKDYKKYIYVDIINGYITTNIYKEFNLKGVLPRTDNFFIDKNISNSMNDTLRYIESNMGA